MTEVNFDKKSIITIQEEKSLFSYIIVEGTVSLNHKYDELRKITVKDYYLQMKDLKDSRKNELLEKTLALNQDILPINNLSDLDDLNTIAYHILLYTKALDKEEDPMSILSFLSNYDSMFENNNKLANELCRAIEISVEEVNNWRIKVKEQFDYKKYGSYLPLAKNEIYQLNYFCIDTIATLKKGDIICKEGIDVIKGIIQYSAIAEEHCILYKIKSIMLYRICKNDKSKTMKDIDSFLESMKLFKTFQNSTKLKLDTENVAIHKYRKGSILQKEQKAIHTIYILKEGRVEIKLNNITLSTLRMMIFHLINTIKLRINNGKEFEKHYDINFDDDNRFNILSKNDLSNIRLNTISLYIIEYPEVFCLIEQYLNFSKSLITIEIISSTADIITIPKNVFEKYICGKNQIVSSMTLDKLNNMINTLIISYHSHCDLLLRTYDLHNGDKNTFQKLSKSKINANHTKSFKMTQLSDKLCVLPKITNGNKTQQRNELIDTIQSTNQTFDSESKFEKKVIGNKLLKAHKNAMISSEINEVVQYEYDIKGRNNINYFQRISNKMKYQFNTESHQLSGTICLSLGRRKWSPLKIKIKDTPLSIRLMNNNNISSNFYTSENILPPSKPLQFNISNYNKNAKKIKA